VDFLFTLTELFLLGVMAEVPQANIDWKSEFLKGAGQLWPNFHILGNVPCEPFSHGWIEQ